MAMNEDKVAFITGANRGIGFETAKGLGESGITVIIGVRDITKGLAAAKQLHELGIKAEAIHYDAAQAKSADAVYEYFDNNFGKLDILVNNAGILKESLVGGNDSSTVSQDISDKSVCRGCIDAKNAATHQEGPGRSYRQSVQYLGIAHAA